jgi:hypothetical protein
MPPRCQRVCRRCRHRAIAGDRGGTDIHNAFGLRSDGDAVVSAAQCGGESARSAPRATATARRRCSPTRPTGWRPRRGDRGRRPGRVSPRAVARQRGPGTPPRRCHGARHAVDRRSSTTMSLRAGVPRASGAGRPPRAACGFDGRRRGGRRTGHRARGSRGHAAAGVVDPETKVLDSMGPTYPFPPAGHTTPPGAILRVNAGGGGWAIRRSATRGGQARRARRVRPPKAPRATTGSSRRSRRGP